MKSRQKCVKQINVAVGAVALLRHLFFSSIKHRLMALATRGCLALWLITVGFAILMSLMRSSASYVLELGGSLNLSSSPLQSLSGGTFILGLRPYSFSPAGSDHYLYLAISFSFSPHGHPAWVANGDNPVASSAYLTLSSDGDLRLIDPTVSARFPSIWSSQTSSIGVVRARLLGSGNLILEDSANQTLWQSFDHPTDTLLPNQPFKLTSKLISQKNNVSFEASGTKMLSFNSSGTALQLTDSPSLPIPHVYWSWPTQVQDAAAASSIFLQLDNYGKLSIYDSSTIITASKISIDVNLSATRRLTLDLDGNLRMYSWSTGSSQWIRVWIALSDICKSLFGICGSYGICLYKPQLSCVCPPGFAIVDPTYLSLGCKPNTPLSDCNTTTNYVEMEGINFPSNDIKYFTGASYTSCKQQCSNDCKCLGGLYGNQLGEGHCWLKFAIQFGHRENTQQNVAFLKISSSDPLASSSVFQDSGAAIWSNHDNESMSMIWQPSDVNLTTAPTGSTQTSGHSLTSKVALVCLATVVGAEMLCLVLTVASLMQTRKKLQYMRLFGDLDFVSGSPVMFTLQDLQVATSNFNQELGSGAFGTVYKGALANGQLVAVKRLEGLSQREKQFRAEITTLGRIHHLNLLRLVGFCAEGNEHRLLVYEYMEAGSLDKLLFHSKCRGKDEDCAIHQQRLNWATRFQIVLGIAHGLTYLHEECLDCILHCDIKPENILLDNNYHAKVADFGMAYLFNRNDAMKKMTTIRGTRGYLAPEWVYNRPITAKADVYSFGMLAMEIVSGRRNYLNDELASRPESNDQRWCFPVWAYGKDVGEVMDKRMCDDESLDYAQVEAVMRVAYWCIQSDTDARPSMGRVVQMLEGSAPIPDKKLPLPAFFSDFLHDRNITASSSSIPS